MSKKITCSLELDADDIWNIIKGHYQLNLVDKPKELKFISNGYQHTVDSVKIVFEQDAKPPSDMGPHYR